ncbi:unnamed protein product [Linum tenue]|uniref:Uncharacterized protein n=1 Tax=Linum tenue TaxID=586396 RepID=A0AAV0MU93_9ROSI|nr:unnamed protein product [Linum tenue]
MGKLASAREYRMYGPTRQSRNRAEYINAGLYLFATVVLISGFAAQFSGEPRSGLVLLLIALLIMVAVNVHDMVAHLSGIDFRLPNLMELDPQLALVEFAVPLVLAAGALLWFLAVLFLFLQAQKGYRYLGWERHSLNMVVAGTAMWVLGSIHNVCQIYERADAHVQILQQTVQLPFLMGSLLFLVGAILNSREQAKKEHHGLHLLGTTLVWMSIYGSLMFFVGGLANVVKVFKMQQMNGLRLEKLRGGALERLMQGREGQVPLIIEEQRRRSARLPAAAAGEPVATSTMPAVTTNIPTPYKDVLLGHAQP